MEKDTMSRKNGFTAGIILGAAAGFAAKFLLDNKDQLRSVVNEKSKLVLEGVSDLTDYAKEKFGPAAENITKTAEEYVAYAKEQYEDFKSTLNAEFEDEEPEAEKTEG